MLSRTKRYFRIVQNTSVRVHHHSPSTQKPISYPLLGFKVAKLTVLSRQQFQVSIPCIPAPGGPPSGPKPPFGQKLLDSEHWGPAPIGDLNSDPDYSEPSYQLSNIKDYRNVSDVKKTVHQGYVKPVNQKDIKNILEITSIPDYCGTFKHRYQDPILRFPRTGTQMNTKECPRYTKKLL